MRMGVDNKFSGFMREDIRAGAPILPTKILNEHISLKRFVLVMMAWQ